VIIGRSWFAGRQRTGSPDQEDPEDYVRFEIETALASDVPVIPVLVEGARMPDPEELPLSIRALAYRQATRLTPNLESAGIFADHPANIYCGGLILRYCPKCNSSTTSGHLNSKSRTFLSMRR